MYRVWTVPDFDCTFSNNRALIVNSIHGSISRPRDKVAGLILLILDGAAERKIGSAEFESNPVTRHG